ncbi:hypothetical protein HYC85_007709 [Camellia sinensis]|uniref:Uncharacterized protein n=1 Tax=Camellia sinensis TaxID=4442 RepID=A0A7J7HPQ5_CAMSI|nr:hypothetical protein HYC85_007709 [Camellia sinensis]
MSVEQMMATQSDIDSNSYTLKSYMETVTAISNLFRTFANRVNKVYRLNVQLSLYQRMYQDAQKEIGQLKTEQRVETKGNNHGPIHSPLVFFDSQRGVISFGSSTNAEAGSSKCSPE